MSMKQSTPDERPATKADIKAILQILTVQGIGSALISASIFVLIYLR
ncbi:hypothetical protein [Streptomyces sp. NPDC058751]